LYEKKELTGILQQVHAALVIGPEPGARCVNISTVSPHRTDLSPN
jgi:hypothetical protein